MENDIVGAWACGYRVELKSNNKLYRPCQWLRLLSSTSWDLTTLFTTLESPLKGGRPARCRFQRIGCHCCNAPASASTQSREDARKEIADAMWETIVHNGVDCIFDDKLPAAEEYSYMEVPLTVLLQQTNAQLERDLSISVDKRARGRRPFEPGKACDAHAYPGRLQVHPRRCDSQSIY